MKGPIRLLDKNLRMNLVTALAEAMDSAPMEQEEFNKILLECYDEALADLKKFKEEHFREVLVAIDNLISMSLTTDELALVIAAYLDENFPDMTDQMGEVLDIGDEVRDFIDYLLKKTELAQEKKSEEPCSCGNCGDIKVDMCEPVDSNDMRAIGRWIAENLR